MCIVMLKLFNLSFLCCNLSVDSFFVRVIVCERSVNLGQCKMLVFPCDLFWAKPHLIPSCDPHHGNASSGNTRTSSANVRRLHNHCSNIGRGSHKSTSP